MTKDEVIKEAMEKLGAELFPRGIENRLRFVYNEGLKAGRLEIKYTEESMQQEYRRGYEDAYRDARMDEHCAICEYEETKPEEEPCRDCMYSHLSKFSRRPSITNAEKFREVFGGDPQASTFHTYCPPGQANNGYCKTTTCTECLKWWDQPYEEPEDDE